MPENGTYLLTNVGFSKEEEPILVLQHTTEFVTMTPLRHAFTLTFDMSQRYCVGWSDISKGERYACPDMQKVDAKFEQCPACQKRTGFNPAFYHSTSVSAQQEARNLEPHSLYLAHFGPDVVKIGISHAKRGYSRLLEQGARSALILGTFASAHIARQYEARIAALPGISESIQLRKKVSLLTAPYDTDKAQAELLAAKQAIEAEIPIRFDNSEVLSLDNRYFPDGAPLLVDAHSTANSRMIAGTAIGMIGSVMICQQGDDLFYLPLKSHVGYRADITDSVTAIDAPARQISLF
jgi:hypothetical protein